MDALGSGESEIAGFKFTERVTVKHYNVFGGTSFLTSPSHIFFLTYYWSPQSDILACIWLLNEVWMLFSLNLEALQPRRWCMIAFLSFCYMKWIEFYAHTERLQCSTISYFQSMVFFTLSCVTGMLQRIFAFKNIITPRNKIVWSRNIKTECVGCINVPAGHETSLWSGFFNASLQICPVTQNLLEIC